MATIEKLKQNRTLCTSRKTEHSLPPVVTTVFSIENTLA